MANQNTRGKVIGGAVTILVWLVPMSKDFAFSCSSGHI
jgi:hypothetical protein